MSGPFGFAPKLRTKLRLCLKNLLFLLSQLCSYTRLTYQKTFSKMLNDQRAANHEYGDEHMRDIHALTPPQPPPNTPFRRRDTWETNIHRLSSISMAGTEYSGLVLAGSTIGNNGSENDGTDSTINNLGRILQEEMTEEMNPFALVADNNSTNPLPSPRHTNIRAGSSIITSGHDAGLSSVQKVKKEEVESKISAWRNANISKINNRFKREEAIISGWENEQVQKFTSSMKKVERKLEEKRARALEKMQNDIAKAHRKAEERRATSEGTRGTKVAGVLEVANLMRALGRAPAKRPFF